MLVKSECHNVAFYLAGFVIAEAWRQGMCPLAGIVLKKKGLHILMYCKELLYVKNKSY